MISALKKALKPWQQPTFTSAALLLIRVITGTVFVFHGWPKIQMPFGWMGPEAPIPGIFQFLAALAEFGGGIALILGVLPPRALGIGITMAVAVYLHMVVLKNPFANMTGAPSYELGLVYLGIAILLLAVGAGKFSLDAKLFGKRK